MYNKLVPHYFVNTINFNEIFSNLKFALRTILDWHDNVFTIVIIDFRESDTFMRTYTNIGNVLPILMPELDGSSFLAPQLPARLSANRGRSFSNSATEARPSHPQPKWGKCNACTWMQPRSASQTRDTCSPDRFMSSTRRARLPDALLRPRQSAFTTHSNLKSI